MTDDPMAVVKRFGEVLTRLGVKFVVGGSLASSTHGFPRSTQDIDLVVVMTPDQALDLEATATGFMVDGEALQRALRIGQSYNIFDQTTMTKIDLFPASGRFERNQIERAVHRSGVPVLAAEDAILAKLRWFRKGGEISDRQWRDVLGILQVQGDELDTDHLRGWAQELGVTDLLDRARREQGSEG